VKLPNADRAIVDIVKLRDYCLNPLHPEGRHKARVFQAVLGIGHNDAEELRLILLAVARDEDALPTEKDEYGQRYVIDFLLNHMGRRAIIGSAWIIRTIEDFPRLATCYVLKGA
jgi:uncharacterized protein DUF6883